MNKRFITLIFISILLGFFSANLFFDYKTNFKKNKYNTYFLQTGVYSSLEDATKNVNNLGTFIVSEENGKYHVYVGITTDVSNKEKIEKIYANKNIKTSTRKLYIDSNEFMTELKQYDILLKDVKTEKDTISVNEVILSTYEQVVLNT